MKPKDLMGMPWAVAFALRDDGWWLRQDIVWHKTRPMPESIRDRCTKAHEYLFLLSKNERYYFDSEAISEPAVSAGRVVDYTGEQKNNTTDIVLQQTRPRGRSIVVKPTRNKRSVWSIAPEPYKGAHFAVMPTKLVEPCILAGSAVGDTVLDPFCGSGTVGVVALRHQRMFVGIDLTPEYIDMAATRLTNEFETRKSA
jgi:DNA modification methylase